MSNTTPTVWNLEVMELDEWRRVGPATFRTLAKMGVDNRKWRKLPVEPEAAGAPPFHALLEQMGIDPPTPGLPAFTVAGWAELIDAIESVLPEEDGPDDDNCADDLWAD